LKRREAGVAWTADEDATLRAGVESGESWETIAAALPGRTLYASKGRARTLGLERSEKRVFAAWTEAEDGEIRAGVEADETTALEEGEVKQRWTEAEDAALREGFESGKSWKEVAVQVRGNQTLRLKRGGAGASA
jgi:hypothetical protein